MPHSAVSMFSHPHFKGLTPLVNVGRNVKPKTEFLSSEDVATLGLITIGFYLQQVKVFKSLCILTN
jgi:hypothetical protein